MGGTGSEDAARADLAVSAGAGWARLDFVHWPSSMEGMVEAYSSRGISILASLLPGFDPTQDTSGWRGFVRGHVQTYGATIKHWGVWNEPNCPGHFTGTPAQYDQLVSIAAAEVHSGGGISGHEGFIVAPDIAWGDTDGCAGPGPWLAARLVANPQAYDVVSIHRYGNINDLQNAITEAVSVMNSAGLSAMKLWLTEFGATGQPWESDAAVNANQADLLFSIPQLFQNNPRLERVFLYHLVTYVYPERYGMVQGSVTAAKRDAYYAFRHIAANCPECVPVHRWWRWGDGMWSRDINEGYAGGYSLDEPYSWYTSSHVYAGFHPLFRCVVPPADGTNGMHYITQQADCSDPMMPSVVGALDLGYEFVADNKRPGTDTLFRFWHPNMSDFVATDNRSEALTLRGSSGWQELPPLGFVWK